jgi:signal transduction histidine kinase
VLIALVWLPFRSSFGLAGILLLALLVVTTASVLGGTRPAIGSVAVAVLAGTFSFVPPFGLSRVSLEGNVGALVAFAVVGVGIAFLIDELAGLAEEQAALQRVATLVARAAPPDELFAAITEELGHRLPVDITNLSRYGTDGTVTVVAGWARAGPIVPAGSQFALGGHNLSTLVAQTGQTVRLDHYDEASGPIAAIAHSVGSRSGVGTPIFVAGELWGIMTATSTQQRPLPRDTETRLTRFTDLLATAIANAESRTELAASRARIVSASDEARRQIERDLHDGTQQRLVSLGLELRTAENAVPADMTDVKEQLSHIERGLAGALEELQELARGIHPAVLARGGLAPAIKMLARRSALPVELDLRANVRLPERVEVAAYYVVSEALTNAAKHAQATLVQVDLDADAARMRLAIRDDGRGSASPEHGSGLVGLRDRVEALGGEMQIASPVGRGTSLSVTIPIAGA